MTARPAGLSRRELFAQGISLAGVAMLGCSRETPPVEQVTTSTRPPVPLRVLVVSHSESSESLSRAWSAFDDGELNIRTITVSRSDAGRLNQDVVELASKSDVLIYPLLLVGELFTQSALITFEPESLEIRSSDDTTVAAVRLATAPKTGLARFADQSIGLPLGGIIPALFTVDAIETPTSWADYDTLVSESMQGQMSEPTAAGWAAAMFLWRSLSVAREGWLFERETMQPLIATEPYVEALELMRRTHERYTSKRLTPEAIWTQIQQGELRGGITFPPSNLEAFPDLQVAGLPSGDSVPRVVFDPFTPIASISAACRQSGFAKKFVAWLGTADGAAALSQCVSGSKQVVQTEQAGVEATVSDSPYDTVLDDVWQTPLTLPGLQLLQGGKYYAVLDSEIGKVLEQETDPREALQAVAKTWSKLTAELGVKEQLRVWNQAQGRRS